MPSTIIVDCGSDDSFIASNISKILGLAKVAFIEFFEVKVASGNLPRV